MADDSKAGHAPAEARIGRRPDEWAMSKGIALGMLTGVLLSLLFACVAYYLDWDNARSLVHLILDRGSIRR
jgi:ABC-type uncharacterized transport system permease subunit